MTDSDIGRIKKTNRAQKIRTEICRIFLIAKWCLIHYTSITYSKYVVVAGVKLKILKANHNKQDIIPGDLVVVVAGVKLKILKANHNIPMAFLLLSLVVVAGVKLKILKANHNPRPLSLFLPKVVVAGVKLKILKANHNRSEQSHSSLQLLLLV